MSIAFLFPGQGCQRVGMGKAFYDAQPTSREVYDQADHTLGWPISKLCFEGPMETLSVTSNTQPAVLTTCLAQFRALGERPDAVAGHSLGEYTAHVAAGTLSLATAVRAVSERGQYMQHAAGNAGGKMLAVIGSNAAALERICAEADGLVQVVNYNSPEQVVISGESAAVDFVCARLAEQRIRTIALATSAPFHTTMMRPAEHQLRRLLSSLPIAAPSIPVYANVDSSPVTTAGRASTTLAAQVSRPVLWARTIQRMIADGVRLFVEVSPSRALAGMLAAIDPSVSCETLTSPKDLKRVQNAIRAARRRTHSNSRAGLREPPPHRLVDSRSSNV
ncbi:MAG: hypothetical protein RL685_7470 [Pseudomonadota bacterium]|jgi:[acyl-carrier-protein] S-malonyltransferase